MSVADVHLIVQQPLIVGAQSKTTGITRPGAGRRGDVDGSLPMAISMPSDTLVADAQDAFGVGGHQQVDIVPA